MAKKRYEAVFSDGMTVKRSTENEYKTAWQTKDYAVRPARVMGTGFSASLSPSGVRYSSGSLSYMLANERDKERGRLSAKNRLVKTEVVKAARVK